jgi:hypothetical protein
VDKDLETIGEALDAALASRADRAPDASARERLLAAVARRGGPARPRWWRQPPVLVGGAALGLLLAASLGWGLSLNAALAQERTLRSQLSDAAARDEVVFEIVDSRSVAKTTLRSTADDSPTAPYGKVFTRPDMAYVVAMVGRLAPAPHGREYHLYLDGKRIGTLTPNDAGFAYLVFRAENVGISYVQARVVAESPDANDASGSVVLAAQR